MTRRILSNVAIATVVLAVCLACAAPSQNERPSYAATNAPTTPAPTLLPSINSERSAAVAAAVEAEQDSQWRGQITEEHDEFRRNDLIKLRYRLSPDVSMLFVGSTSLPGTVAMGITLFATSWRYLRCHDVDALVDGEPLAMPEFQHDGEAVRGGVTESVVGQLGDGDIETMARARSVRVRVCRDVYTLNQQQLQSLRRMLDRFRAMTAPPVEEVDSGAVAAPTDAAQSEDSQPEAVPPRRRHHHAR